MTTLPTPQTGVFKRVLLDMAFEECGLAGFELDRTAEEVKTALRRLNALMGEWPFNLMGYEIPPYGVGQPEDFSNIADEDVNVVAQQLAMRLAPAMARSLSPETRATYSRSLSLLHARYAAIPDVAMPAGTPLGRGGHARRRYTQVAG